MSSGSEKKLVIKVGMDRSVYKAEAEKMRQEEKRRIQELLSDEQVAEKAKAMLIQETNRKRVLEAKKASEEESKGWFDVQGSIETASTSVAAYLAATMTLKGAGQLVLQVAEYWDRLHRQQVDAAMELTNYRAKLLELAALKDSMGQTGPELANQLRFRSQTLQTADAAIAMQQAGLGIGEVAIDKAGRKGKISKEDFGKLMVSAGKMQTMEGGSPTAYGTLAGLIPLMSPERITAEQGEAKMDKLFRLQQPGGFTNFTQAIGQFQKLSGYVQTGVVNDEEAMGLLSAFSIGNRESAGTLTEQAIRAVSAGVLRSRGMHIASDQDAMKTDQFFKDIGVTTKTRTKDRLTMTSKHLAGWMKQNPSLNIQDYLITRGFGSQEERNALSTLAGLEKEGNWDVFEKMLADPSKSDAISGRFNKVVGNDVFMQTRQADMLADALKVEKGLKTESLVPLQKAAFTQLRASGELTFDSFDAWHNQGFMGSAWNSMVPWGNGDPNLVNLRAQSMVINEATRLGLPNVPMGMAPTSQGPRPEYIGDRELMDLKGRVEAAGGNPLNDAARNLNEAAARIYRSTTPVHPPMQGTPPEIRTRP